VLVEALDGFAVRPGLPLVPLSFHKFFLFFFPLQWPCRARMSGYGPFPLRVIILGKARRPPPFRVLYLSYPANLASTALAW